MTAALVRLKVDVIIGRDLAAAKTAKQNFMDRLWLTQTDSSSPVFAAEF